MSRVLIVQDTPEASLDSLKQILEALGYTVEMATVAEPASVPPPWIGLRLLKDEPKTHVPRCTLCGNYHDTLGWKDRYIVKNGVCQYCRPET